MCELPIGHDRLHERSLSVRRFTLFQDPLAVLCGSAVLAVLLSACATVPAPQRARPTLTSGEAAAIDAFVAQALVASEGVGASVSVFKDGVVLLEKAYGSRSLDPAVPATVDTPFALASVSKQFTVGCLLLLVDDGRVSVSDPVSKWFPSLTRASDITLLDLINHVSGYRDYYPLNYVDRRMLQATTVDEVVARYAGGPLDFEPRSRMSYSNTGYLILGRVVELISGEPLGTFIARRIFGPLGMTHSEYLEEGSPPASETLLATRAKGYGRFALGPTKPVVSEAAGWLGGAAAIWSTASDLSKWQRALVTGTLLSRSSFALMMQPRTLISGAVSHYGGGLSVMFKEDAPAFSHSGALNGFRSYNVFDVRGTSVVMLTNFDEFNPATVASKIFEFIRPRPSLPLVKGPSPVEVVRTLMAQLQAGAVDRNQFTEDFAQYLNTERLRDAKEALSGLGLPTKIELREAFERGGLAGAEVKVGYESAVLLVTLYRRSDGTIEEFSVSRDL